MVLNAEAGSFSFDGTDTLYQAGNPIFVLTGLPADLSVQGGQPIFVLTGLDADLRKNDGKFQKTFCAIRPCPVAFHIGSVQPPTTKKKPAKPVGEQINEEEQIMVMAMAFLKQIEQQQWL